MQVTERPAIAEINIEGNKKLKDEDIDRAFEDADLVQGNIYNDQVLDNMQKELERLYYSVGRYGVKLNAKVTPLPRNRVEIDIDIQEGVTAKIRQINIVGNEDFTDEELLEDFELGIPSWYMFLSSKDEYAKNKLSGDIETLRSYYLNRGYLNYRLDSIQVTISPDKKDIYITVNIHEGDQYTVDEVYVSGETVVNKNRFLLVAKIYNRKGEYFSNKNATDTSEYIDGVLGNMGYAFSQTRMQPDIDERAGTVDLNFVVEPGKRTYVRRIGFSGNEKTMDHVYRREVRQLEGAWYADNLIERSKVRLQRLNYVEEVEVDTPRVAGTNDQVDIEYNVTERMAGSFNIGAGYSGDDGVMFNTSLSHSNLLGTGNAVQIQARTSEVVDSLSFTYSNPYYTNEGVGRSISLSAQQYDTARTLLTQYVVNSVNGRVAYTIPMTEYSSIRTGFGVSTTEIEEQAGINAFEIVNFLDRYGDEYEQLTVDTAYLYDTRNRSIFVERGSRQVVSLEWNTPGSDLEWAKLNYNADYYWPAFKGTVLHAAYDIGVGEGFGDLRELPFYEKYVSGGVHRLRGFESRSIGPRTTIISGGRRVESLRPLGGDLKTVGQLEYIVPTPGGGGRSMRLALFYDFGNVYATRDDFDVDEFRSSIGLSVRWMAPIGAMTFSYAEPQRRQPGDEIERFQFSVGGSF
jgi:outer membrane protein insertion porin family